MPEERSPILSSIQNIFSIPDLRKRVLFMLGLLAVYRVGAFIPTPGINHDALEQLFQAQGGTIFGFLDIFSGGSLRRFSIFALGIMPYITASIILQLATVVVPYLEKLSKEGELGRKKITQYTRYLTVALTLFQGFMTAVALERSGGGGAQIVSRSGLGFPLHGHDHPDHRHGFYHVGRRTDHRARNRQWHQLDYFCRHRCGFAESDSRDHVNTCSSAHGPFLP